MDGEQILKHMQELLDAHARGALGYIGQEPYQSDFFELFKEAYRGDYFDVSARPRLTGDAIRDTLQVRWIDTLSGETREKSIKIMNDLLCRWDDWRYAWDKYECLRT